MSEIVAVMIAVAENVTVAKILTGFLKKHVILLIKNTTLLLLLLLRTRCTSFTRSAEIPWRRLRFRG